MTDLEKLYELFQSRNNSNLKNDDKSLICYGYSCYGCGFDGGGIKKHCATELTKAIAKYPVILFCIKG